MDQPQVMYMDSVIFDRHIRVGIVDDSAFFRRFLHSMLKRSLKLQVVAQAENGSDAISLVDLMHSDVVLMDISMPVLDGIEATRVISSRFSDTKVVVLTMYNDQTTADSALQAGACKFLTKDCSKEEILNAIKECSPGQ